MNVISKLLSFDNWIGDWSKDKIGHQNYWNQVAENECGHNVRYVGKVRIRQVYSA
jgi:hypothetical protein